jgi:hypothetical protein
MVFKFKKRKLGIVIQAGKLKKHFPESSCRTKNEILLVWKGKLQPTPLSQKYTVLLKYKLGQKPSINVVEPKLIVPDNGRLPHTFAEEKLCVYFMDEWKPDMNIAETIIPWVSEWLLHYEIWLATGEWQGGGIHPNVDGERRKDNSKHKIKEIDNKIKENIKETVS